MVGRILLFALWAWGIVAQVQAAPVPLLPVHPATGMVELGAVMALHRVPAHGVFDPDAQWARPLAPTPPEARAGVEVEAGATTVGRIRLAGGAGTEFFVLQATSSRLDRIRVWWRPAHGTWRASEGGDRVPLSRWPFQGPFPAVAIPVTDQPVDVLVALDNGVDFRVPLLLEPQKVHSDDRLRQANLSGLVMGMGVMVALVCLMSAFSLRGRAGAPLAAFAIGAVLAITSLNGYAAIWLYPESPAVNDGAKLAASLLLSALMLWSVTALLDRLDAWRWLAWVGPVALGLAVVASALLLGTLPAHWRLAGALAFTAACLLLAAFLCVASRLQGARHVPWVAFAVLCYLGVTVLVSARVWMPGALDLPSAAAATLLFGSALLLRHAHEARMRYGRDVLGRAAVSANRDPLTALLSYQGLQQRHAEIALREAAGQPSASMLALALPGLEHSGAEHGFVVTERALVRFAATLQAVLGSRWAIGRLSKSRFAAFSLHGLPATELVETATRVLTRCARETQPLAPIADFDLRIVCRQRLAPGQTFDDLLRELEEATQALDGSRRIALR